jgi:hypothetical protein
MAQAGAACHASARRGEGLVVGLAGCLVVCLVTSGPMAA